MSEEYRKLCIVLVLMGVMNILFSGGSFAKAPDVELIANPDKREFPVNFESITLIADYSNEPNLKFQWTLEGVGKLDGTVTEPNIIYIPPKEINGESAKAIVTVKVTNDQGEVTTKSREFKIINVVTPQIRPTPTNGGNDCTSITADGYDVLFSPVDHKDWRKWGWVELALKYARQEKASVVLAYEVYEANKVKKTDEYYATWRFEVEGTVLNYRYLPGTPTIEVGSCWKQFEGKIPNDLLALGSSKIVIYVLKQK